MQVIFFVGFMKFVIKRSRAGSSKKAIFLQQKTSNSGGRFSNSSLELSKDSGFMKLK